MHKLRSLFSRIFSINTVILAAAAGFLWLSVTCGLQSFEGAESLTRHAGLLASKQIVDEKDDQGHVSQKLLITLAGDSVMYTVTNHPKRVDNLAAIGDSVYLYTRELKSYGNFSSNGAGTVQGTDDPNEVLHLTTPAYGVLTDFEDHRSGLRAGFFGFLFGSLAFLGWFFYRRSGKKSPFVQEYGGWTVE